VGFLTSAPALGSIFLSVPAGARLEGRTDLVRIVIVGRLLMRLCYLAMALVPFVLTGQTEIWAIVVFWTLTSIPGAVVNPAWTAVVAAIVPPRRRPSVNGTRWALLSVVTAIAGAGFGRLLDALPSPASFQTVFLASFVAGLATLYTFGKLQLPKVSDPPGTRRPTQPAAPGIGDILRIGRDYPPFARFVATSFVYRIGLNLPVALFSIYWVREAHASNTVIGIQSTAANLALVASYLLWGRVAARRGHRIVLLLASAGTSFYPLATAFVQNELWLVPVALIWGTFASGIDVSFFEALLRTCPAERLQTFIGINSALANVVIFLAPIGGTLLADAIGIHLALVIAAVVSLVGTILFYTLAIASEEAPVARIRAEGAPS
jgi:MFS family permease